jgi:hypothetical protein
MNEDKTYDMFCALEQALIIIVGEYPKEDNRYVFATQAAKQFNIDLGENG